MAKSEPELAPFEEPEWGFQLCRSDAIFSDHFVDTNFVHIFGRSNVAALVMTATLERTSF
jgi:hypothetical protein